MPRRTTHAPASCVQELAAVRATSESADVLLASHGAICRGGVPLGSFAAVVLAAPPFTAPEASEVLAACSMANRPAHIVRVVLEQAETRPAAHAAAPDPEPARSDARAGLAAPVDTVAAPPAVRSLDLIGMGAQAAAAPAVPPPHTAAQHAALEAAGLESPGDGVETGRRLQEAVEGYGVIEGREAPVAMITSEVASVLHAERDVMAGLLQVRLARAVLAAITHSSPARRQCTLCLLCAMQWRHAWAGAACAAVRPLRRAAMPSMHVHARAACQTHGSVCELSVKPTPRRHLAALLSSRHHAAVQMERAGARLVERDMGRIDLALSAASAIIVWRPDELQAPRGAAGGDGDLVRERLPALVCPHLRSAHSAVCRLVGKRLR